MVSQCFNHGDDRPPVQFEFATAGRIVFGAGRIAEVAKHADRMVSRPGEALVVTGSDASRAAVVVELFQAAGFSCTTLAVSGEPTVDVARAGAKLAREKKCGIIVGIGGGSAIDAGKAIAALAANPEDPMEYLEVVGNGRPLTQASLPYIAVPTTAGTGAEVTRNAVLSVPEHRVKVSLRSATMLPRLALLDPELTRSMPPAVTAATGLDALTQLIEPFVSVRSNPMTDALCREGMARVARSLRTACEQPNDGLAREDMMIAALFGGLALANAGLGAVHGLAGPIGGMLGAPHGAVCAVLLPQVMAANVRESQPPPLAVRVWPKYQQIARILTGSADASIDDGITWVRQLIVDLKIPSLRAYGIAPEHIKPLVEAAHASSSMKGNPVPMDDEDLERIIHEAY